MNTTIKQTHRQFLKFSIVGISGTIVDFGLFNIFYSFLGLPKIFSSILSFSIAVINNFFWNRLWTYPESKNLSISGQLAKFALISVIGLLIRTPLFAFIEPHLVWFSCNFLNWVRFMNVDILGTNIALAIVILIVLFWNYFANRFWTYRTVSSVNVSINNNGS